MKNWKILVAVVILFSATAITNANAQGGEPPFVKGSNTIGASLGFGVDYGYAYGSYGSYTPLPAIAFTFDHGSFEKVGPGTIGIGGVVGFKTARWKGNGYKETWTNYIIGARGTYHLTLLADKNNKFDPYAGITIGFRIFDHNYDDGIYGNGVYHEKYNTVYPIAGAFIGAKYNFADSFGAFAEVGYDISLARIGICFNF